jgi:hypothetical protein
MGNREETVKKALFAGPVAALLLAGCGALAPPLPRPAVGEESQNRRVVSWRLVERTYGTALAGHAGDGNIPPDEHALVYQPVYLETRRLEYGAVQLRSACQHDVSVTIRGGTQQAVGLAVTALGRITAPAGLTHELAIEPTGSSIEILEIRGALPMAGKPGRYVIEGSRSFEVVFTSHSAGKRGIAISIVREIGHPLSLQERRDSSPAPVGREREKEAR